MASFSVSVVRNDGSSALFEFQVGEFTIGQQQGQIATLDPSVADPHGALHFDGRTLSYVDGGSAAGSFLPSGQRLTSPLALQPGATVCFGTCRLTVQEIRADAPIAAPAPVAAAPAPVAAAPAPVAAAPVAAAPAPVAAAPAPVAAAPAPVAAASPMQAAQAAPAPQQAAAPFAAGQPASAGVVDQLVFHVRSGLARYKTHYLHGVLTIGLVLIPGALINALLGWIPIIGTLVAILVGLAELLIVPLSAGAMGRWALATAAGKELHWKKAWKNALKDPGREWLNMALVHLLIVIGLVLLIVPGLIIGMFALPAYLLENKRFVDINVRSADLVMKDAAGLIGLGLLTVLAFVPAVLVLGIVLVVLAFVPLVGEPLGGFIGVAFGAIVGPFLYLLWAQIYYATIQRLEGKNPAMHGATIDTWSAVE